MAAGRAPELFGGGPCFSDQVVEFCPAEKIFKRKLCTRIIFDLYLHRFSNKAGFLKTYGVIGNTADFGSVVLGSSPSRST